MVRSLEPWVLHILNQSSASVLILSAYFHCFSVSWILYSQNIPVLTFFQRTFHLGNLHFFYFFTGIVTLIVGLSCTGTSVYTIIPVATAEMLGRQNVPSIMSMNFFYEGVGCVIATFCAGR